jgi:hypothetical protein
MKVSAMGMAKPELTKVIFDLEPDAPSSTETLWAKPLGDSLYKLDNAPWYARGCALGDVVRCSEEAGELPRFVEVVRPSGNRTVRVFVPDGPRRQQTKRAIAAFLSSHGSMYEGMATDKGLIAVTIPSDARMDAIFEYLDTLEANEQAYWESANFDGQEDQRGRSHRPPT